MKKIKEKIKNKLGEKKTASLKRVLKVVLTVKNIVCWTLIAVLTLAIVTFMMTRISGGTPSFFGYSMHRIVSGSMEPELLVGDVILNKNVSDPSEVNVGDIVTFQGDIMFDDQIVTHRVLVAPYDNGNGDTVLVTKGDANEEDDGDISFSDVKSKYITKVNFLKYIYNFFFSKWGLIVFIFLLLLIFFDEILNIIKISVSGSVQENTESIKDIIERVKSEQLQEAENKQIATEQADKNTANNPKADKKNKDKTIVDSKKNKERNQKSNPVKNKNSKKKSDKKDKNKKKANIKKKQPKKKSKSNNKTKSGKVTYNNKPIKNRKRKKSKKRKKRR